MGEDPEDDLTSYRGKSILELLDAAFKVVATMIMILIIALMGGALAVFLLFVTVFYYVSSFFGMRTSQKKDEGK